MTNLFVLSVVVSWVIRVVNYFFNRRQTVVMVLTDNFCGGNMVVPDDFGGGNMVVPAHFGGGNMVVPDDFEGGNMVVPDDFGDSNMVVTDNSGGVTWSWSSPVVTCCS